MQKGGEVDRENRLDGNATRYRPGVGRSDPTLGGAPLGAR